MKISRPQNHVACGCRRKNFYLICHLHAPRPSIFPFFLRLPLPSDPFALSGMCIIVCAVFFCKWNECLHISGINLSSWHETTGRWVLGWMCSGRHTLLELRYNWKWCRLAFSHEGLSFLSFPFSGRANESLMSTNCSLSFLEEALECITWLRIDDTETFK